MCERGIIINVERGYFMNSVDLKKNASYSESEIIEAIRKATPSVSETKVKWLLFDLERTHVITRIGSKKYVTGGRLYTADLSEPAANIDSAVSQHYPEIEYVIWESSQLNEWINLMLAKNVIFVEVESGLKDYVFSFLQEQYGRTHTVLLDPDHEMLSRYIDNDPVVVRQLFSRSPRGRKGHRIILEKLLVDVVSDKLLKSMIGTNDREEIVRGMSVNYSLNITKILAYAKRRRCESEIQQILEPRYDR